MDNDFVGGVWTKQKLEILRRYLDAYTTALKNQSFQLVYVDAFAGDGRKRTDNLYTNDGYGDFDKMWDGSPRIALDVRDKPFDRFLFIENNSKRVQKLRRLEVEYPNRNIQIVHGDANEELICFCDNLKGNERAVVFLDPFATEVSWETIPPLAKTEKIDCWILFPLHAVIRMLPTSKMPLEMWEEPLNRVFGGRQYWYDLYQQSQQSSMFDDEPRKERSKGSERIAAAYRSRLDEVFCRVAQTRRTLRYPPTNIPLFDLFFAASNPRGAPVAIRMADHILKNW